MMMRFLVAESNMIALGNPSSNRTSIKLSILSFSVTPHDLFGRWIDHRSSVMQHTRNESTFATSCRSVDDARERVFPPCVHGHL